MNFLQLDGVFETINPAMSYGYSNSRVRALKGLLLTKPQLLELLKVNSLNSVIELLQKSGYGPDLVSSAALSTGLSLFESALSKNFSRNISKLIKITPKKDFAVISALLVKFDLTNLKTLMHARKSRKSFSQVRSYLFPVGGISEVEFQRILSCDERSLASEVFRTKFGKFISLQSKVDSSVSSGVSLFKSSLRSSDAFLQNEPLIDGFIYTLIDSALESSTSKGMELIRSLLVWEIDIKNSLIVLRMRSKGLDFSAIKKVLIPSGSVSESFAFRLFEAKEHQTVISVLKTKFSDLSISNYIELSELEIALEKNLNVQKSKAFHRSILSAAVIAGFVFLKETEVSNLRKIAVSKEFGLENEKVEKMIVVV